jgi:hypothetical protein
VKQGIGKPRFLIRQRWSLWFGEEEEVIWAIASNYELACRRLEESKQIFLAKTNIPGRETEYKGKEKCDRLPLPLPLTFASVINLLIVRAFSENCAVLMSLQKQLFK